MVFCSVEAESEMIGGVGLWLRFSEIELTGCGVDSVSEKQLYQIKVRAGCGCPKNELSKFYPGFEPVMFDSAIESFLIFLKIPKEPTAIQFKTGWA